jgi:hypothetical protein
MHQDSCDLPPPQPSPASGGGSTLSLPLALRRTAQCASLSTHYALLEVKVFARTLEHRPVIMGPRNGVPATLRVIDARKRALLSRGAPREDDGS